MTVNLRPPRGQFLLIDLLKALAAQVIVFHHLSIYGPISSQALSTSNLVAWLSDYGRYAVQVFLVLGGYLAMMTLPAILERLSLLKILLNRYLRLVPAFVVVILFTTIVAFFVRQYLPEELVGSPATFLQIMSHVFLLHGILNIESISAGAWYIAIDWQLYAFLSILIALFGKSKRLLISLILLMLGGFLYFSKYDQFDVWMIYFIGSYGLGVLAFLASDRHDIQLKKLANKFAYLMAGLLFITLVFGAGAKAFVALSTFLALLASNFSCFYLKLNESNKLIELIRWFSHRSYCLFLIHYPFILLFNALYEKFELSRFNYSLIMMWVVWGVSVIASNYLYKFIEKPTRRLQLT